MDEQVNPLERDHTLCVVLPSGLEKNATVHGSKPVMDLLVTLCASYHLSPSDYTVEVLSTNKNNISFKPNSPIGSLEAEKIVLKPRGVEEKIKRPYIPEASVRLLINYNKSHKAVVRVSPRVPLRLLLPIVCNKCEFREESTVLLRDSESGEPLDLGRSLNELGLREVYARDTAAESADQGCRSTTPQAAVTSTDVVTPPLPQEAPRREREKKSGGFLSLFRKGKKKKTESEVALSVPVSPGPDRCGGAGVNGRAVSSSNGNLADMPKKRPAPPPPLAGSLSVPSSLGTCELRGQVSADSTLMRTKRRAPPPPCAETHQAKGNGDLLNVLEESRESDESDSLNFSLSSSSSPQPSPLRPFSSSSSSRPSLASLHELADPYLPSFRGKDLSDARAALAKVLTSSVSKGALIKRLKNSSAFPKFPNGGSSPHVTHGGWEDGARWSERLAASSLPAEPEWEDPSERRGTSTFKVVPSGEPSPDDVGLAQDVAGQTPEKVITDRKASPKPDRDPAEAVENQASPQTETSLLSRRLFSQETKDRDGPVAGSLSLDSDSKVCLRSQLKPPTAKVGDENFSKGKEQEVATAESELGDEEPSASDLIMEDSGGFLQSSIELPQNTGRSFQKPSDRSSQNSGGSTQNLIGSPQSPCGSPLNSMESLQNPSRSHPNPGRSSPNPGGSTENPSGSPENLIRYSQNPSGSPQSPIGSPQSPCGSLQNSMESLQNPNRSPQIHRGSPENMTGSPHSKSPTQSGENPIGSPQTSIASTQKTIEFPQNPSMSPLNPGRYSQNPRGSPQNPIESYEGNPCGSSPNPIGSTKSPNGFPRSPCGSPKNSGRSFQNLNGSPQNSIGSPQYLIGSLQNPIQSPQNPGRSPRSSESSEMDLEEVESMWLGEEEVEEDDDAFPPPPSPVFFMEDSEEPEASPSRFSRPPSPASEHCEDPQPTNSAPTAQPGATAEPLEMVSAAPPSRFAEAVALAVQRSRLQRQGKGPGPQAPSAPHSALPSPHISIYQFGA